MKGNQLPRRRLALAVFAVVIPSVALAGLGVGLILQESQLAESRREEAHEATFQSFVEAMESIASRQRDGLSQEILERGWSAAGHTDRASVILIAQVLDGELRLPWEISGDAKQFGQKMYAGTFGRTMLRAERLEFASNSPERAVRAYRMAAESTADSLQKAFAKLSLTRALEKSGLEDEANAVRLELLHMASQTLDDFGVPLALYAAQKLASKGYISDELLESLAAYVRLPLHFSPQASYLYRAIHDTLLAVADLDATNRLAPIGQYAQVGMSSVRLRDDFGSILPRLISQAGERAFALYSNDDWLLSIAPGDAANEHILIVLDAGAVALEVAESLSLEEQGYATPLLSSDASPPNRWLGPFFQDVYARFSTPGISQENNAVMGRISFIILAMVLIMALSTLGFYLWWRDTQREVVTAQLRSDFVSSVSHELKTPLTSVRMFAETLRYRSPPDSIRDEYLDTIINESSRLTRLLNNVLDFSKIEKGVKDYDMRPTVLQKVAYAALDAMEYPIRAQQFTVLEDIDESEIRVHADSDALEQVILNLLTNALKFSGDRREIQIGIGKNGASAELRVTDWGIGIDPKDFDHIFDSYFRAENASKKRIPGTGLGLALVRHAVEAHDGTVHVTSQPGQGSTFTIRLPML